MPTDPADLEFTADEMRRMGTPVEWLVDHVLRARDAVFLGCERRVPDRLALPRRAEERGVGAGELRGTMIRREGNSRHS